MIDFHTHILPAIDDGSKNTAMTTQMLLESKRQGVETVVATPHFYPHKVGAGEFLSKRNEAFEKYFENIETGLDIPKVALGAEVYFCNGLSNLNELDLLTINSSRYILLELPFEPWSARVFAEIESIIADRDMTPIIAHFERYIKLQKDKKAIYKLFGMNVIIQSNAEYFTGFWTQNAAIKFLKNDIIGVIGSDCHNMTTRPPNLKSAYDTIQKKCGSDVVDKLCERAEQILGGTPAKMKGELFGKGN